MPHRLCCKASSRTRCEQGRQALEPMLVTPSPSNMASPDGVKPLISHHSHCLVQTYHTHVSILQMSPVKGAEFPLRALVFPFET